MSLYTDYVAAINQKKAASDSATLKKGNLSIGPSGGGGLYIQRTTDVIGPDGRATQKAINGITIIEAKFIIEAFTEIYGL